MWRVAWRPKRAGRFFSHGDGYGPTWFPRAFGYFRWWSCGPLQVRRYE